MKRFEGSVTKIRPPKTVYVEIVSEWMHPKYLKKTKVSTVFACHNEIEVGVGDVVSIVECRPISATKHFKVEKVVKKIASVEEAKLEKVEVKSKKLKAKKEKTKKE